MPESNDLDIAYGNAHDPEEPEYGKGYKPWENAGCCGWCGGSCNKKKTLPSPHPIVIKQRHRREDFL